jgi:hypothetical protein
LILARCTAGSGVNESRSAQFAGWHCDNINTNATKSFSEYLFSAELLLELLSSAARLEQNAGENFYLTASQEQERGTTP